MSFSSTAVDSSCGNSGGVEDVILYARFGFGFRDGDMVDRVPSSSGAGLTRREPAASAR